MRIRAAKGLSRLELELTGGGKHELIDNISVGRKYERDIDLLLAEEFAVSPDFAKWFLTQTKSFDEVDAQVDAVYVSKSDATGESDLVVVFKREYGTDHFALLIEDKIDAPLQPKQVERYRRRAADEIARTSSSYSEAAVIICAPQAYKEAHPEICAPQAYKEVHPETETFDAFVSYEAIAAFLKEQKPTSARNEYRATFIETAGKKKINAPTIIYEAVTDSFWKAVYKIATSDFPDLNMKPSRYARGTTWVSFRPLDMPSMPKLIRVDLKGASGLVDLTFPYTLCRVMQPLVKSILEEDMEVHQTGRACAIRLCAKPFTICEDFETMEAPVRDALAASVRLVRFYFKNRAILDSAASVSSPQD